MKAPKPGIFSLIIGLILFSIIPFKEALSQSFAYKTLLSTLYEKDFPVLYPEEIDDLSYYQVLDTREKEEYQVSHLKGAVWVGYDQFPTFSLDRLDKSIPVLVYCTVGARSQNIGKKLIENGYEVYNLYGGIIHWANEEYPLYKGENRTDKVHTYTRAWGIWLNKGVKVYE
ncbi:rhodanese-like domain-containing protein [Algoriphagus algorifonticola]|uniref:rhodanese-like domain-containing protein n=1 Tax=Algoriphagus algorifonticola TaxID=2593007 RepID=UPI00119DCF75|nr:rhodanese-like domain-containing protein [Algoriphagus algorifonticola]